MQGTPLDQQDPTAKMHFVSPDRATMLINLKVNFDGKGRRRWPRCGTSCRASRPRATAAYLVAEAAIGKDTTEIVIRDIERNQPRRDPPDPAGPVGALPQRQAGPDSSDRHRPAKSFSRARMPATDTTPWC